MCGAIRQLWTTYFTAFAADEEGAMEAVVEFMDVSPVAEIASDLETNDAAIPTAAIQQLADRWSNTTS